MGNRHATPLRDQTVTEYGKTLGGLNPLTEEPNGRAEIALKSGTIEARLLSHLIASCECLRAPEAELPELGFRKCVDYLRLPRHTYYEGYFHSLVVGSGGGPAPFSSINPRLGVDFSKPAAPRALRAFYEAMRRKNMEHLCAALDEQGITKTGKFAGLLRKLMGKGRAFADLAIQIHAGTAVPREHIGWHTDASNSILHLALAIQGSRALHSMRAKTPEAELEEVVEWQQPGSVYVSSPAFFQHGVQYPQAYRWSNRCIAIQARLLYTQAEFSELEEARMTDPAAYDWLGAFSRALASKPIELPSFEEVKAIEAELEEQEAGVELSAAEKDQAFKGVNGATLPPPKPAGASSCVIG